MKFRRFLFFVLLLTLTSTAFAQKQHAPGPERYVIIGVFGRMSNTVAFTDRANKQNFQSGYVKNPRNKLYYVYIYQSLESKKAQAFMMKVRLETEYKDAWVYRGSLGAPIVETTQTNVPYREETQTKEQPLKEEPVVKEQPKQEPVIETPKEQPKEEPKKEEPKVEPVKEEPVKEEPVVGEPTIELPTDSVATPADNKMAPKPVGKPFFFKLVNDAGEPLDGEVHVFDGASQNYQAFPANQIVYLPAPRDPSQVYEISTLSAGYQESNRAVNYTDPSASSAEIGKSNEFVISMPLVHVKMGDYIEFSNVRFFQNSVMLHPEAREELDGLAELLKENPRYKVNIHAHCNGTQERNIIVRGNSNEYFGSSTGNQRKTVSAKELTELRAQLVKDYLVTQGVDGSRISTKGEGGAALIYPVNSTLSNRNDRVEVEVKRGK